MYKIATLIKFNKINKLVKARVNFNNLILTKIIFI